MDKAAKLPTVRIYSSRTDNRIEPHSYCRIGTVCSGTKPRPFLSIRKSALGHTIFVPHKPHLFFSGSGIGED